MERIRQEVSEANKHAAGNLKFEEVKVETKTEEITEQLENSDDGGTMVLGALNEEVAATTVLDMDEEATTVLNNGFVIVEDITLCQSKEIIKG